MTNRQIATIPDLCRAIIAACDAAKATQARFLESEGITMDQARAMPASKQAALQDRYTAWLAAR